MYFVAAVMEYNSEEAAHAIMNMSSDLSSIGSDCEDADFEMEDDNEENSELEAYELSVSSTPSTSSGLSVPIINETFVNTPDCSNNNTEPPEPANNMAISVNLAEGSKSSRKRKSLCDKYPMLPTCNCKKNCVKNIPEETRQIIHEKFWEIDSKQERDL